MRVLTNKQLLVFEVLCELGPSSAKAVAIECTKRTPCGRCAGSGKGDTRLGRYNAEKAGRELGCGECYGRGTRYFDYGRARQALERLVNVGKAERRSTLDEWGDPTQGVTYTAVLVADPADPLERLFSLPAARAGAR